MGQTFLSAGRRSPLLAERLPLGGQRLPIEGRVLSPTGQRLPGEVRCYGVALCRSVRAYFQNGSLGFSRAISVNDLTRTPAHSRPPRTLGSQSAEVSRSHP